MPSHCNQNVNHGASRFPKAFAAGFLLRGFLHQSSVQRTGGHCEQWLWIEPVRGAPDRGYWMWYMSHIIINLSRCQHSLGEQEVRSQHGVVKVWWCSKGVEISAALTMERCFDFSLFCSPPPVFHTSVRARLQGGHLPWLLPIGLGRLRNREQLEQSPGFNSTAAIGTTWTSSHFQTNRVIYYCILLP